MPLHLLGKKSWNVYNPANIERVRRDEAEAQAREEAEEKKRQGLEAERRLAILRGEAPPSTIEPTPDASPSTNRKREHRDDADDPAATFRGGSERRKRKRFGEDDTDFEMRVARERTSTSSTGTIVRHNSASQAKSTSSAPLVDDRGHISLFPEEGAAAEAASRGEKNEEAEREAAAKRREFEDQYTMRFSNAAGRDTSAAAGPWYASGSAGESQATEVPGKDAFGRDDPKRKARDAARVVADDPLAMMKRGAAKVRDVERERRVLNEEREKELRELRKEEKRREKRRRRHHHRHHGEIDELEGFSLDQDVSTEKTGRHERDRRERRSGSRERNSRDKNRHDRRSDHDERRERHHRHRHHDDRRRESKSHGSHPRNDREEKEEHSSGQGRRRFAETDNY